MDQGLIHDTAVAMAQAVVGLLGSCIREDERRDAFEEFYCVCRAGLEAFCLQQDRLRQRLEPMRN